MDATKTLLDGNYWFTHGKKAEAERCWRLAALVGQTDAMYNLASLLYEQGKKAEAERWLREAADAGQTAAMHYLRLLLSEQGKEAEVGADVVEHAALRQVAQHRFLHGAFEVAVGERAEVGV